MGCDEKCGKSESVWHDLMKNNFEMSETSWKMKEKLGEEKIFKY